MPNTRHARIAARRIKFEDCTKARQVRSHVGSAMAYIYIERESDIFINGKIVDDFNILDRNYIYTLNVSATQQLHRIIMEQKNEINDLQTLLARLEAIINSSFIVDGTRTNLKRKARIIRNDTNKIRKRY